MTRTRSALICLLSIAVVLAFACLAADRTGKTVAGKNTGAAQANPAPKATPGPPVSAISVADSLAFCEEQGREADTPPDRLCYLPGQVKAPPLALAKPGLITHGGRDKPWVAITFDACENERPAGFDLKLWQVLLDKQAKATIFLGGRWMESHPEETRMIGANPLIEIGNHSYIHPDFTKMSDERIEREILSTQDIQWQLMGKQGRVFRFPYGYYDDRSLQIVARHGLYPIQWEVVSGDPDSHVRARGMTQTVLEEAKNGSIVIFHINGRGRHTAEAMPGIIDGLRDKGFELVTVSEILGLETGPDLSAGNDMTVVISGK